MTITGTDLSNISAVLFGTGPAASVTDVSPTQVTAVSPSGRARSGSP
ncbi:IPT/TIG domain-containing protein [Streptomyces sp. NPDC002545]